MHPSLWFVSISRSNRNQKVCSWNTEVFKISFSALMFSLGKPDSAASTFNSFFPLCLNPKRNWWHLWISVWLLDGKWDREEWHLCGWSFMTVTACSEKWGTGARNQEACKGQNHPVQRRFLWEVCRDLQWTVLCLAVCLLGFFSYPVTWESDLVAKFSFINWAFVVLLKFSPFLVAQYLILV